MSAKKSGSSSIRKSTRRKVGKAIFVVGLQYGDEGKGKMVDLIAAKVAAVARGNGGANAGHSIVLEDGRSIALHQIPSGIKYPNAVNVVGNGVLVDPVKLKEEMEDARSKGLDVTPDNFVVSGIAHLVLPIHKVLDASRESGKNAQGSTKAGIAYVESSKRRREGVRIEVIATKNKEELTKIAYKGLREERTRRNLLRRRRPMRISAARRLAREFAEAALELKPFIQDTPVLLNAFLENGNDVLVEGAQAFGLDINHGKYPYTTSTGCTVAALLEGTGINPNYMGKKIGVIKLTPSKVGGGTFVTKIENSSVAKSTRGKKDEIDGEYGATTGREREVGYLDLVQLKRAVQINGIDELAVTKLDCLKRHGKKTKVAVAYRYKSTSPSGQKTTSDIVMAPASDAELAKCKPVYKEFPTWKNDKSKKAENYLQFIEEFLGIPVTMVSNGPGRDQVFFRKPK